jgi:ComF family protein
VCGISVPARGACPECAAARPSFDRLRAWAILQDPVQEALHKLKYRRDIGLGEALAAQVAAFVREERLEAELVIPIPLGRRRMLERGYNQVALIARPLAHRLGMDFSTRALLRSRETRSQVGLSRGLRRENVQGAFVAASRLVEGKSVLLVDDVATTGSTLSAAGEALRAAGAAGVQALAVARALPRSGRAAL